MTEEIIYKEDVYNLYNQEEFWTEPDRQERFAALYKDGYKYVTHYDDFVTDVIYRIHEHGAYTIIFLNDKEYNDLPSKKKPNFKKAELVKNVEDLIMFAHNEDYVTYWLHQDERIEISIGNPLYEFCYRVLPAKTKLHGICAAPLEVS